MPRTSRRQKYVNWWIEPAYCRTIWEDKSSKWSASGFSQQEWHSYCFLARQPNNKKIALGEKWSHQEIDGKSSKRTSQTKIN